ncbi:MAG: helix-turn-helix transcriptional regulator [Pseudomonadota bacterium]
MAQTANIEHLLSEFERTHGSFAARTWAEADRHISDIYGYKIKSQSTGEPNRVLFGGATIAVDGVRFTAHRSSCAYEGVFNGNEDHYGTGLLIKGVTDLQDPHFGTLRPRNEHEARMYHIRPGTRTSADSTSISAFGMLIPANIVVQKARTYFDDAVASEIRFKPIFDMRTPGGSGFQHLLVHLLTVLSRRPADILHPMMKGVVCDLIASTMLSNLECNLRPMKSQTAFTPVSRNVKRAEEYMMAHADQPITLEVLAQQVGCSGRALQNAFRTFRNKTPISVLREIRLDKARIDLIGKCDTITGVAYRWGFSNIGRFAQLYKDRFGELPSDTLALD